MSNFVEIMCMCNYTLSILLYEEDYQFCMLIRHNFPLFSPEYQCCFKDHMTWQIKTKEKKQHQCSRKCDTVEYEMGMKESKMH